jgi:penicillin-binding protein 1C
VWAQTAAVPTEPCPFHVRVEVDLATGAAVRPGCREGRETATHTFVRWPSHVRRFLGAQHLRLPEPPHLAASCSAEGRVEPPRLVHPVAGQVNLLLPGVPVDRQEIPLEADSAADLVSWFVDGRFLGRSPPHQRMWWTPSAGRHEVVVVDEAGQSSRVDFEVRRRL